MNQQRYSGPGLRGRNRALTDTERADWVAATSRWHETGRRTDEARVDNERVRNMLVTLFEDAVSLPELAEAPGWDISRISGILHRCREEGRLSGSRRYIAPVKAAKQSFRRALTDAEKANLTALYNRLPAYAGGARGWKTPETQDLLVVLDRLADDRVALDTLAEAIGVSRQAVHQHLNRYRATLPAVPDTVAAAA